MNDLISRQAAIDALHMHLMYRMGTDSNKKRLDDWINSLPSAQETHEERAETHACDCISRQAAIDAFLTELTKRERKNLLHTWSTVEVKYFVVDMLEKLPSAESKQRWIPCSERLPEERGFYLTTTKDKAVYCDYWNEDNFDRTEMVIAWMPLPEPYKERREK